MEFLASDQNETIVFAQTLVRITDIAIYLSLFGAASNPTYSGRGGSDLTYFENRGFRPQKGSEMSFCGVLN